MSHATTEGTGETPMRVESAAAALSGGFAENATNISGDGFLELLIAQLQNQDPLSPMDSTDFMSQLSQLQTVSELQDISRAVEAGTGLQAPMSMLGRHITYVDGTGMEQNGTVSAVIRSNEGNFVLDIGQQQIDLSRVIRVE